MYGNYNDLPWMPNHRKDVDGKVMCYMKCFAMEAANMHMCIGKMFNGRIEDILKLFSVRQFIIGPDVHPRRATKLQNDCFENSIPCHDIRTQGAWIHTLDP